MSESLVKEVASWKLDAKLEDTERYFFHTDEVTALERGTKCYVIGRKGTGKTAISEFLHTKREYQSFSKKLTFKNYPLNDLYEQRNERYPPSSQFITLWKYVIYSSVLRLMIANEAITPSVRATLEKVFPADPLKNLSRQIRSWKDISLKLSVLGADAELKGSHKSDESRVTLADKVDDMEIVIAEHIDDANYIITFDELDEGFGQLGPPEVSSHYMQLITSLFKAVQGVKSVFPVDGGAHILPVVFLRDDIFDAIRDPDKAKWADLQIELRWDNRSIRDLLAFRISRAISPADGIMSFGNAWRELVGNNAIYFERVVQQTFRRPRDFVAYLQRAAAIALSRRLGRINPDVFSEVKLAYSRHIRHELEDEMLGSVPRVREIFDVLQHVGLRTFDFPQFDAAYDQAVTEGRVEAGRVREALESLFYFSVIGHASDTEAEPMFRFRDPNVRLDTKRPIQVHHSLHSTLRLRMTRH